MRKATYPVAVALGVAAALIAAAMGWQLDAIQEIIEPVIAEEPLASEFLRVEPGRVAGLHQVARGLVGGRELITLDLWMTLQAENPCDEVRIDGIPPMHMIIHGGTHGDRATVAAIGR